MLFKTVIKTHTSATSANVKYFEKMERKSAIECDYYHSFQVDRLGHAFYSTAGSFALCGFLYPPPQQEEVMSLC